MGITEHWYYFFTGQIQKLITTFINIFYLVGLEI